MKNEVKMEGIGRGTGREEGNRGGRGRERLERRVKKDKGRGGKAKEEGGGR